MKFQVPQYIDIEDRIAFQLTAKQLGWLGMGGLILFVLWHYLTFSIFLIWGAIVALFSVAFAFYRPYGLPLTAFIGHGFVFLLSPKQMVWLRGASGRMADEGVKKPKKRNSEEEEAALKLKAKEKALKNLDRYAKILDINSK